MLWNVLAIFFFFLLPLSFSFWSNVLEYAGISLAHVHKEHEAGPQCVWNLTPTTIYVQLKKSF